MLPGLTGLAPTASVSGSRTTTACAASIGSATSWADPRGRHALPEAAAERAVESTDHWDWLVAGLMSAGSQVPFAHGPVLSPDSGRKHTDDPHAARWRAHLS